MFQIDGRLTLPATAKARDLDASTVKNSLKLIVEGGQVRGNGRVRDATYEWSA